MAGYELRFRQVHLDFHTSEEIPGIGADFDPEEFAATLERARVDSITCFARCHHGWVYYDTKAFPERVHPHAARKDLLEAQVEACHARGIRVPAYITVQWDQYTSQRHPEWAVLNPDGRLEGTPPLDAGFYRKLCVNSPYLEFLKAHTREVLETIPVDGVFFDIVNRHVCVCQYCMASMREKGFLPHKAEDRVAHSKLVLDEFRKDMTRFVRALRPEEDFTIFYNAGHVGPEHRECLEAFTHQEIESLPSGGWGYAHFPLSGRFTRNLGMDWLGMTGKFHTHWGDFHSFKNREALEYECFRMLALNAKCSIGDQLPPRGRICSATYDLIGSVYSQVEKKEPWCRGARAVVDIGVLTPEEFTGQQTSEPAVGVLRMLNEGGHQFDMLDTRSDFSGYKILILPDVIETTPEVARKLDAFVAAGGKLLASYRSGVAADSGAGAVQALGVKVRAEQPVDLDGAPIHGIVTHSGKFAEYVRAGEALDDGMAETEHVMYAVGLHVDAAPGAEVLAETLSPYFQRTYEHFCSHRQAPCSGEVVAPAAVRNGNAVYFSHPVFTLYGQLGPMWCRTMVLNALDLLLRDVVLRHDGPTTLEATVNEQAAENRLVVHLLHYIPERRCTAMDTIQDVLPIRDVEVSLRCDRAPKSVRCVPDGAALDFIVLGDRLEFTVPEVLGHQMVEVAY